MPSLLGALALASALALPAAAQLAQSSFASSTEGWLSETLHYPTALPIAPLGTYTPTWVSSLGGYLRITDPDGNQVIGHTQYWKAPAAFLGDKSAAWCGTLQFDLANAPGAGSFTQEDILLIGGGLTLVHALAAAPVPAFTHYTVPLSESGWKVGGLAGPAATPAQMQAALAAIDALYIRGEFFNAVDTQYLDEVSLNAGPWTNLGFGLAGVSGVPSLIGNGTLVAGSPGSLALSSARPSAPTILFISFASTPVPFKGGTLATVPVALTVSLATDAGGGFTLPWLWPAGIPSGFSLYFQCAVKDAAAVKGVSLSNAVRGLTP